MHRNRFILIGALIFYVCGTPLVALAENFKKVHPNIILITVDTLRADHLGCYGYPKSTSPHLDSFAREGLLFKRCYSHATRTGPSFSSLMTGFYSHETKVFKNGHALSRSVTTLAEYLKNEGYLTQAIVSNPALDKKIQFDQGFDGYDDDMPIHSTKRRKEKTASFVTKLGIDWLERNRQKKFFLWIHYMDPHGPYKPPPPYSSQFVVSQYSNRSLKFNRGFSGFGGIPNYQRLGKSHDSNYYLSQYDGEIAYLDSQLDHLFQKIDELGLMENSLIVFTADHGEELGEHEFFFCHGETLNISGVWVPLIISFKGKASINENPVQHIDLVPTILEAVGKKYPGKLRGRNILVDQPDDSQPILSQTAHFRSLIQGDWRLLYDATGDNYSLYDLKADPMANRDLATSSKNESMLRELKEKMMSLLKDDRLGGKSNAVSISEERKEELRSLGYAQ